MRRFLLLASLLCTICVGVAFAPSTALSASKCDEDGHCKGVLLCRESRCVQVHCRADAQCPAGRMCRLELCRIRQCYRDGDCTIDRLCDHGLCVVPQPLRGHLDEPVVPGVLRVTAGPIFPLGLQGQIDVPLGDNRWVTLGVGTTISDGGLSWRLGLRGAPFVWRAFAIDAWAGAMGFNVSSVGASLTDAEAGAAPKIDPVAALLGSGRWLFAQGRGVHAVWWGGGAGLMVPHGPNNERILRIDFGLLLLFDDIYPRERDFAILPTLSLQYGWEFDFDSE